MAGWPKNPTNWKWEPNKTTRYVNFLAFSEINTWKHERMGTASQMVQSGTVFLFFESVVQAVCTSCNMASLRYLEWNLLQWSTLHMSQLDTPFDFPGGALLHNVRCSDPVSTIWCSTGPNISKYGLCATHVSWYTWFSKSKTSECHCRSV